MSTDNEERVPDSEACPSDDEHDGRNATDEDASPSQYKKSRRDDDDNDDGEHANDSEGSSHDCADQDRMKSIDRESETPPCKLTARKCFANSIR